MPRVGRRRGGAPMATRREEEERELEPSRRFEREPESENDRPIVGHGTLDDDRRH